MRTVELQVATNTPSLDGTNHTDALLRPARELGLTRPTGSPRPCWPRSAMAARWWPITV